MIKESCKLIGQEHIVVYYLKLCIKLMKKFFFFYLNINQSFVVNIFNLAVPSKQPKAISSKSRQAGTWLGMSGQMPLKLVVSDANFSC